MRSGFRFLAIGVALLLVLTVGLGAALILRNFSDDELLPEVLQLLQERPGQITADENGYFAWIGVVGPADVDPHLWGRRWFAQALTADKDVVSGELPIDSEVDSSYSQREGIPCVGAEGCLAEVGNHQDVANEILQQFSRQLDRCDAVLGYKNYQEAWRPDLKFSSPFPHYPFVCGRIKAVRIALAVAEQRDSQVIAHLEDEIALHVRQLKGSITLLEKLLAIRSLRNDYLLLNDYLIKRPEIVSLYSDRIELLLAPLDKKARSMAEVLKSEWLFSARSFLGLEELTSKSIDHEKGIFTHEYGVIDRMADTLLFLPNATVNETFQWYSELADLEQLSGDDYLAAIANVGEHQETDSDFSFSDLTFRNPVGSILASISRPYMLNYFKARDELLAIGASVAFHYRLIRQEIQDHEIHGAVENAQLFHRFTGEKAVWDRENRQLVYPGSTEFGVEEVRVRL
jgi:hypothetical protein